MKGLFLSVKSFLFYFFTLCDSFNVNTKHRQNYTIVFRVVGLGGKVGIAQGKGGGHYRGMRGVSGVVTMFCPHFRS